MGKNVWQGGAGTRAEVVYAVPAAVAVGNKFTLTLNGKSVSFVATAATVANVTAGLAAAVAASTEPEWAEVTATDSTTYLRLTATTPGLPAPSYVTGTAAKGSGTGAPTLTVSQTLSTPVNAAFTDTATGGTLAFNTAYYYRVSAINEVGETLASTETSKTTANDAVNTHKITVLWGVVPGATGYKVYGRSTGAELYLGGTVGESSTSFIDDGSITPSGALPGGNTTAISNQGPHSWATAANWSLAAVPVAADDVYLTNSAVPVLYDLDQNTVVLGSLNIDSTFTADLGLPNANPSGYTEFRTKYLKIRAPTVNVGAGTGQGSGRLKHDAGSGTATTWNVLSTGQAAEQGLPALLLLGTNAGNVLNLQSGNVGVAVEAGQLSTVATARVGSQGNAQTDSYLTLGEGCTLTTVTMDAGTLAVSANVTTLTVYGGASVTLLGATAVTTLNLQDGSVSWESSGTIATATVGFAGLLDCSQDPRPRTVTSLTLASGATFLDPNKTVTFTNPFAVSNCGLDQVTLELGANFSLQRS